MDAGTGEMREGLERQEGRAGRLWLLRLVPDIAYGRWLSGVAIFVIMACLLAWAGGFLRDDGSFDGYVSLFFCVIVAYVIPVFHFITARTQRAFDELVPMLTGDADHAAALRRQIAHKHWRWVLANLSLAVGLWVLQIWLLAGVEGMVMSFTSGWQQAVQALATLVVWISMTCVVHALIDNAILFRSLAKRLQVDVYDTRSLTPFGSMAVSSVLAVVGSQASFSIMWLGDMTNPWTTIPGMVPTTVALVYLFFAPVWPLHKAIRQAKNTELAKLQRQINQTLAQDRNDYAALVPLLAMRREVAGTAEWPVDLSLVAKLGLYLVIVPLTWIGAALIENVVDVFVS